MAMMTATMTFPEIVDLEAQTIKRLDEDSRKLSQALNDLFLWENDHIILQDEPPAKSMAEHKKAVNSLLSVARILESAAIGMAKTDTKILPRIQACRSVLSRKIELYHGKRMSKAESDRILKSIFPDA